jgi:hypothetical protein
MNMSSRVSRAIAALIFVSTAMAATGCGKEERGEPIGGTRGDGSLPLAVRSALDEGNAHYRGGQFEAALASYREAATAAPGEAAPWYGVYMAATALGNQQLADSAMTRINASGGVDGALSDSTVRDMHTGGGGGAMPKGHPPADAGGALPPGHPPAEPSGAMPKGHPPIGSGAP